MPYGISTEPPICTSPRPLHRGILQKSPMWQIPCGLIICSSNCHLSWGELVFCPHSLRRILPYIPVRPSISCSWKYTTHLLQLLFSQIKESRWQILNFEVMRGVFRVWPCSSLSAKVWTKGSGKNGGEIRLITWTPEPKERSSYLNKRESGTPQVETRTRFGVWDRTIDWTFNQPQGGGLDRIEVSNNNGHQIVHRLGEHSGYNLNTPLPTRWSVLRFSLEVIYCFRRGRDCEHSQNPRKMESGNGLNIKVGAKLWVGWSE